MTHLHDDPAEFAADALVGLCDARSDLLRAVPGGVVRRRRAATPKVAVLYGGGSGHYPAFAGLVGPGMGDAAVCGNVFTSPSVEDALSVARAAHYGAGIVFSYGNYAGDVLNFGQAQERLRAEGLEVDTVLVTDDVASAPSAERHRRRGIAGDFTVFKVLGAAAERGDALPEVIRLGHQANEATRTLGVAFAGCTLPGAAAPLFEMPAGQMGLGLGIHGEPGIADVPLPTAAALADILVERVLDEYADDAPKRAAVILNGLGATKYEELFVLWKHVGPLLRGRGIEIIAPEVGEIVTSLDMAGVSLTLMALDEELEPLWLAATRTAAFSRDDGLPVPTGTAPDARKEEPVPDATATAVAEGTGASRRAAVKVQRAFERAVMRLRRIELELGRLDAVAGDGDHGRGMVRGCQAATEAARRAIERGAGAGTVLQHAGDAWGKKAGGTSGALWGAALSSVGAVWGDERYPERDDLVAGARAFLDRLQALGGASVGDKTMLDAVVPFVEHLTRTAGSDETPRATVAMAAAAAAAAAEATSELSPKLGRARPLAEKSLGHRDPGAVSFAQLAATLVEDDEPDVTERDGPSR